MLDKGDAIKLETGGNQEEIVKEPDVSSKKRKSGEPDVNRDGASSSTADTPKRENLSMNQVRKARNCCALRRSIEILCDTSSVDFSQDRTAQSGKFPEDE